MVNTSQRYPALRQLRVVDAMHPGLISCSLDTPLRTVARMMASYRVHAILVTSHGEEELPGGGPWGIVADTDLLRAAEQGDVDAQTARTIAATPVLTVASSEDLAARGAADGRARALAPDRDRAAVGASDRRALDARRRPRARRVPGSRLAI